MNINVKNILVVLLVLLMHQYTFAQELKQESVDELIKDSIYASNKSKIVNYSMKDFEKLFFEFSEKKFDPNLLLSKEEFYSYTVKIAIFSDRLATLYPEEKEVAKASKKKWLSERYEDYLLSKQSQKK